MMPEMGGMDCLDYFLKHVRHVQVILMTGTSKANTTRMAVEAMKRGAFDYVSKPIDTDELIELIKHAAHSVQLDREVRSLRRSISAPSSQVAFLGASDKTRDFIRPSLLVSWYRTLHSKDVRLMAVLTSKSISRPAASFL